MPVHVGKHGDQYCVFEPGGTVVNCHDTEEAANRQARAINANSEKSMALVYKTGSGLRRMILLSSNAYEDREGEIVKQRALENYVAKFNPQVPQHLLFWHEGEAIGRILEARMVGPFLFEMAEEIPNRLINIAARDEKPLFVAVKDVWDAIENSADSWGVSIGFQHRVGDELDKAFDEIIKFETSVLPLREAANAITFSVIV